MEKTARIIVGLGYGDEGKGTMVDFLCRHHDIKLVVRYNGGSQAAHNVLTDDKLHHTFSQIGSGAFVDGVKTFLSRFMMVDPIRLLDEAEAFALKVKRDPLDIHYIDARAPVITFYHIAANRIKEWLRGDGRHGSCGMGIGELGYDLVNHPAEVIRMGHLLGERDMLIKIMSQIRERKFSMLEAAIAARYEQAMAKGEELPEKLDACIEGLKDRSVINVVDALCEAAACLNIFRQDDCNRLIRKNDSIFEGAQGVLLDEWHGFHPYTTWSTTTQKNAIRVLRDSGFSGECNIIGVTRCYGTRHGAGPFIGYDPDMQDINPQEYNIKNDWQGDFRFGKLDAVQLKYACRCVRGIGGKLDSIALTHLDVFDRGRTVPCIHSYRNKEGVFVPDLQPAFDKNLDYQQALTDLIINAQATAGELIDNRQRAIDVVARATGCPVKYVSAGPATKDKSSYPSSGSAQSSPVQAGF